MNSFWQKFWAFFRTTWGGYHTDLASTICGAFFVVVGVGFVTLFTWLHFEQQSGSIFVIAGILVWMIAVTTAPLYKAITRPDNLVPQL